VRGRRRCRLHGGRSTGPRTLEGKKSLHAALVKHGRYSIIERELAADVRELQRSWYASAASERDALMRQIYFQIANREFSAAELDALRDAILESRLGAWRSDS
jgi:hypothetical protein